MIRRSFRIGLILGLAGGLAFALAKTLGGRAESSPDGDRPEAWPPLAPSRTAAAPKAPRPEPARVEAPRAEPAPTASESAPPETAASKSPSKKAPQKAPAKKAAARAWVEPTGDTCPTSHPVKAKLSSKIFHLPGMLNYERTNPDRCYRDPAAAEGDGLRAAKR